LTPCCPLPCPCGGACLTPCAPPLPALPPPLPALPLPLLLCPCLPCYPACCPPPAPLPPPLLLPVRCVPCPLPAYSLLFILV